MLWVAKALMFIWGSLFAISTALAQEQCPTPNNWVDPGTGNGYVEVPDPGLPGTQNGVPGYDPGDTYVGFTDGESTSFYNNIPGYSTVVLSMEKAALASDGTVWKTYHFPSGDVSFGSQGGNLIRVHSDNYMAVFTYSGGEIVEKVETWQNTCVHGPEVWGCTPTSGSATRYQTYRFDGNHNLLESWITDGMGITHAVWQDGHPTYTTSGLGRTSKEEESYTTGCDQLTSTLDSLTVSELEEMQTQSWGKSMVGISEGAAGLAGSFFTMAPKLRGSGQYGAVLSGLAWAGGVVLVTVSGAAAFVAGDIYSLSAGGAAYKYGVTVPWPQIYGSCIVEAQEKPPCYEPIPVGPNGIFPLPYPEIYQMIGQNPTPAPADDGGCLILKDDMSNYACWYYQANPFASGPGG